MDGEYNNIVSVTTKISTTTVLLVHFVHSNLFINLIITIHIMACYSDPTVRQVSPFLGRSNGMGLVSLYL